MRGAVVRLGLAAAAAVAVVFHGSALCRPPATVVAMVPKSGADIQVSGYFSQLPLSTSIPLQVSIKNATGADRTWRLRFEARHYGLTFSRFSSEVSLSVGDGAEKTFEIQVPLVGGARGGYASAQVTVQVSGFGVAGVPFVLSSSGPMSGVPALGMSESLAANNWEILKESAGGRDLPGGTFDPGILPADWRGYASLGSLWMSETEWDALAPQPRSAIRSWVGLGGMLVIATQRPLPASGGGEEILMAGVNRGEDLSSYPGRYEDPSAAVAPGPRLHAALQPAAAPVAMTSAPDATVPPPWASEAFGYGAIVRIPWDGSHLSSTAGALVRVAPSSVGEMVMASGAGSSLESLVSPLSVHGGLLLLFLVAFSVCVGPLNLFLFCRGDRRFNIFWTAPLMSAGAALVLAIVIFAADGTGGTGSRWTAVLLLPEERLALTVQEQIARTGALLSTRFALEQPVLIQPIASGQMGIDRDLTRELRQAGKTYSGDWFSSRSLQAQFLESVQPSRTRVELVAAPGGGRGPELVSSIDRTLEEVYLVTEDGRCWHARGVRTGERATLTPFAREEFDRWWRHVSVKTGARGRWLLDSAAMRRGWFYASAPGAQGAIDTLASIGWKQEALLFLGPYATSASKESS
jgi:hypothetical protein